MKKIIISIVILILGGLVAILIFANKKNTDLEFYTIPENYSFVETSESKIYLYVYSTNDKPLISYADKNSYQLKLDGQSVYLNNVECDCNPHGNYNIVTIKADTPDITDTEYLSESCNLIIKNGLYTLSLDMGSFSILDSKYYELISLDTLSATYSNIDGLKNLTGINLTLSHDYNYLTSFRIGGFVYGSLSRTKFDVALDNEDDIESVIINYNHLRIEETYTLGIQSNKMLIPVGYLKYAILRSGYMVFEIDGSKYYFDAFPFMTTNLNLDKYKALSVKGELSNA